jgi:hypothetical protein
MLTLSDLPQELLDLYSQSKSAASAIIEALSAEHTAVTIDGGTDLLAAYPSRAVCFRSGMCKYHYRGTFVRFYAKDDIILTSVEPGEASLLAEFAAEAIVLDHDTFIEAVCAEPELRKRWLDYECAMERIMSGLCASYAPADHTPEAHVKHHEKGAEIIREGDSPDKLYEMIEGSAAVTVKGTQIGEVHEGETFGEVSFLTGTPRCATVTARTDCTVQELDGADLEKIARYRPGLVYSLSQTLARRLTEVNSRLVSICSLT